LELPESDRFTVAFALTGRAKKDLTALKSDIRVVKQFKSRFERLVAGDEADGKMVFEKYCSLKGHKPIDEIKVSGKGAAYRCFCFKEGTTYWLTHCAKKGKSDQWYSEQAEIAKKIRENHLVSQSGG
jgi:Phage derived protein Gp49-like (DUF891)